MSSPFRRHPDGFVIVLAVLVAVPSFLAFAFTRDARWALLGVLATVVEFGQVAWHDRRHRSRGERPHAMWGPDDKNKPMWLRR